MDWSFALTPAWAMSSENRAKMEAESCEARVGEAGETEGLWLSSVLAAHGVGGWGVGVLLTVHSGSVVDRCLLATVTCAMGLGHFC